MIDSARRFASVYWQELLAVMMFAIWAGGYFTIAASIDPTHTDKIPVLLDTRIPFIPEFVFIYVGLYPMYIYPYLLVRDAQFFKEFTSAYITVMVICFSIFVLFPVSIDRPVIDPAESFTMWVLSLVYSADKPVNCFPSTHVAMTMMSALTIFEINRPWGLIAIFYALAIATSTLFVKQHYVLDVVVGIFIALMVYYVYYKQRIMRSLGKNFRVWQWELEGYFGQWLEARLGPVLDRIIAHRVEEIVTRAIDKRLSRDLDPDDSDDGEDSDDNPTRHAG
ncbi:phosphatase PAP2 family protein [bacterium]|nr:phosphatase PAP2 family protein [bacterium]